MSGPFRLCAGLALIAAGIATTTRDFRSVAIRPEFFICYYITATNDVAEVAVKLISLQAESDQGCTLAKLSGNRATHTIAPYIKIRNIAQQSNLCRN